MIFLEAKMNKRVIYPKGNVLTFPLELAEVGTEEEEKVDLKYLYPIEAASIQKMVENVCDQMEYDGSMMYDKYPDKTTFDRMVGSICCHRNQCCDQSGNDTWIKPMVGVMLCHEMDCRRDCRCRHKKRDS